MHAEHACPSVIFGEVGLYYTLFLCVKSLNVVRLRSKDGEAMEMEFCAAGDRD